jgi:hypothetical protein
MIFQSEIRNYCPRTQPAKGHEALMERAQIKMWCKLARGVRAKNAYKGAQNKEFGVLLTFSWVEE